MPTRACWPLLLLAASCRSPMVVPAAPAPVAEVPVVDSFEPRHAFAGGRVEVRGSGFGSVPGAVEVRFGASGPVRPVEVTDGGRRLLVHVPDDGGTGRVAVDTAAGRSGRDGFVFDGLGRPRFGRVKTTVLRPPEATVAVPFGDDGTLAVLLGGAGRVAVGTYAFTQPLRFRRVLALAAAGPGRIAMLGTDPESPDCLASTAADCTDVPPSLVLVTVAGSTTLALPGMIAEPITPEVAFASDGATGIVSAGEEIWVVEPDRDPPRARSATPWGTVVVAPVGGTRWVVGQERTLELLDAASDDLFSAVPYELEGEQSMVYMAAGSPDGSLVLLDLRGELQVLDASVWPPAVRARGLLDALGVDPGFGLSLACSDDGTRCALSQDSRRITLLEVESGRIVPIASVPVAGANGVVFAAPDLFHVAHRGGVSTLSARTGSLLRTRGLEARSCVPSLHREPEVEPPQTVLSACQGLSDAMIRLDPATLESSALWDVPLPNGPAFADGAVRPPEQAVTAPDGRRRVVRFDEQIQVLDEMDRPLLAWTPPDPFFVLGGYPGVRVSSDGAMAWIVYRLTGTRIDSVALLDPAAPATPVLFDAGAALADAWVDGGRLVLTDEDGRVRAVDAAALLRGEHPAPAAVAQLGMETDFAPVLDGRVYALRSDMGAREVVVVSLADGATTRPQPVPVQLVDRMLVSPSGRWVFALESESGGQRRLAWTRVDPFGDAVEAETHELALPGTVTDFMLYPDGEHLVAVDTARDAYLLVE